jgi:ParB family chromosome partitioning protein
MATNKKAFAGAKRSDTFVFDPDDIIVVGHDTSDGPEHHLYDQRIKLPLDEGMVASILAEGVILPIIVTSYDGKDKAKHGRPAAVDGRQRILNAREAKKRQLKAGQTLTVRVEAKARRADEKRLLMASIITNELRADDDMLVKSEKAARLRDMGATVDEIATAFGVSTKAIEQWFALSEATGKVKQAVAQGQLAPTAAAKIAKLEGKEAQEEALAEVLAQGKPTARAAKAAVNKRNGKAKDDDGAGVGKKVQKKLLDYATGTPDEDKDPYWEGARDVLRVILGDKAKAVAGKMKTALRKCGADADACGE